MINKIDLKSFDDDELIHSVKWMHSLMAEPISLEHDSDRISSTVDYIKSKLAIANELLPASIEKLQSDIVICLKENKRELCITFPNDVLPNTMRSIAIFNGKVVSDIMKEVVGHLRSEGLIKNPVVVGISGHGIQRGYLGDDIPLISRKNEDISRNGAKTLVSALKKDYKEKMLGITANNITFKNPFDLVIVDRGSSRVRETDIGRIKETFPSAIILFLYYPVEGRLHINKERDSSRKFIKQNYSGFLRCEIKVDEIGSINPPEGSRKLSWFMDRLGPRTYHYLLKPFINEHKDQLRCYLGAGLGEKPDSSRPMDYYCSPVLSSQLILVINNFLRQVRAEWINKNDFFSESRLSSLTIDVLIEKYELILNQPCVYDNNPGTPYSREIFLSPELVNAIRGEMTNLVIENPQDWVPYHQLSALKDEARNCRDRGELVDAIKNELMCLASHYPQAIRLSFGINKDRILFVHKPTFEQYLRARAR